MNTLYFSFTVCLWYKILFWGILHLNVGICVMGLYNRSCLYPKIKKFFFFMEKTSSHSTYTIVYKNDIN